MRPSLEIANLYTVRWPAGEFPHLTRSGRITAVALGPRDWDSPAAHAVIEALLE